MARNELRTAQRRGQNLTRESLEQRFDEPFPEGQKPVQLNAEKSYLHLRGKYLLPTAQMQLPEVAPIYTRFIRERASWDAGARTLSRERSIDIRARKKEALKSIDNEFAEARKMVRDAYRNDREARLILAAAKIVIAEEKLKIRADAKRRLRAIAEKRPPPLFRQWLKRKVAEGDIPAINALTTLRTIGLSRAAELLAQTSQQLLRKGLEMNPTETAETSRSLEPELSGQPAPPGSTLPGTKTPTYPLPKSPEEGRAFALKLLEAEIQAAPPLAADQPIPKFLPNGRLAGYKMLYANETDDDLSFSPAAAVDCPRAEPLCALLLGAVRQIARLDTEPERVWSEPGPSRPTGPAGRRCADDCSIGRNRTPEPEKRWRLYIVDPLGSATRRRRSGGNTAVEVCHHIPGFRPRPHLKWCRL